MASHIATSLSIERDDFDLDPFRAEGGREIAGAFQNYHATLLHPLNPLRNGSGRDLANDDQIRGAADGARESDGG